MTYYQFTGPEGPYGSFETFYSGVGDEQLIVHGIGWFWWPCFPGCMPDGEPNGPFPSEQGAIEDAQDGGV